MEFVAIGISALALVFAAGSFWWLNARRGSLTAAEPQSFAFASGYRLRIPFVLQNDGAVPLLVSDLRLDIEGLGTSPWQTVRDRLRPESEDGFAFATPFSVTARGTKELIAEFGEDIGWEPEPGRKYQVRVEAQIHPSFSWTEVLSFGWWAPAEHLGSYIAHRNEPSG